MYCHWSFGPGKIGPGGPFLPWKFWSGGPKLPVKMVRHWKYLSGQSAPLTQVNHKASRHFYGIRSFQALASKQLMLPASRHFNQEDSLSSWKSSCPLLILLSPVYFISTVPVATAFQVIIVTNISTIISTSLFLAASLRLVVHQYTLELWSYISSCVVL